MKNGIYVLVPFSSNAPSDENVIYEASIYKCCRILCRDYYI